MAKKFKSLLNLLTLSSDPLVGSTGDVYFNVTNKNIKIYNGLDWVDLTPVSADPTPFYMHTHTYDGDVHTIDISNPITFSPTEINNESPATVQEETPIISGYDGGSPSSTYENANYSDLTLLDGGGVGN